MFRLLGAAMPATLCCLLACSTQKQSAEPIEKQASEEFGMHIARVTSEARAPRMERCYGEPALVVPPRSSVEIPI
ncbi:MAG TPA: hypothetical protein PKA88_08320, partial [Polyangiaceae bacterium]|nr:hypothetical protein [Polyangiaceae bacterium]